MHAGVFTATAMNLQLLLPPQSRGPTSAARNLCALPQHTSLKAAPLAPL